MPSTGIIDIVFVGEDNGKYIFILNDVPNQTYEYTEENLSCVYESYDLAHISILKQRYKDQTYSKNRYEKKVEFANKELAKITEKLEEYKLKYPEEFV